MSHDALYRFLPRPDGPIKEFAEIFGGYDISLNLVIPYEGDIYSGLTAFLAESDEYEHVYRGPQRYQQLYLDLKTNNVCAAYAPIDGFECIGLSKGMRFLIHRTAHLVSLLFVEPTTETVDDLIKLIYLIKNGDYGIAEARALADYELPRWPWYSPGFSFDFTREAALDYKFLVNTLTYFVLEHERRHAWMGHGVDLNFKRTGNYIGDAISNIDSSEYLRVHSWLFELSADWHAVMKILAMLDKQNHWGYSFLLDRDNEHVRLQSVFLAGAALLVYLLYIDSWNRVDIPVAPFVEYTPTGQNLYEVKIRAQALVNAIIEARNSLALSHPHGQFRLISVLTASNASGAPKFVGEKFAYNCIFPAMQALHKLSMIDKALDRPLWLHRDFLDLESMDKERIAVMSSLLDSEIGVEIVERAKKNFYRDTRA